MKILIITDLYPPYFVGGYELKCKLHAEELARRGHTVSILTSTWGTEKGYLSEDNVFRMLHTSRDTNPMHLQKVVSDPYRLRRRMKQWKLAFDSRKNYQLTQMIVARMKPDIVFVWQVDDVSISPVLAAQDQGIPTVFRLDDFWLTKLKKEISLEPNPVKRRFRSAVLGLRDVEDINFDHMLVVSHAVKLRYIEVGFLEQNITVLPEGIPSESIMDASKLIDSTNKDSFRLVHVGRLTPEKGTHVAIRALAHLICELGIANVHLDIIGVGRNDYVEQLKNLVAELNLIRHVKFTGFVEHKQVLLRFLNYDAVLIPSLWEEPLSGTIAEAMARGLPVIATDRGGNREILSDMNNGLLVPPDDPISLANETERFQTRRTGPSK